MPTSSNLPGSIVLSPGQNGSFTFTTLGPYDARVTFTPTGQNPGAGGNSLVTITTTNSDGSPTTADINISNSQPTNIIIPYGGPGLGAGAIQFSISTVGAPTLDYDATLGIGPLGLVGDMLNAVEVSNQLNQTSFVISSSTSFPVYSVVASLGFTADSNSAYEGGVNGAGISPYQS